MPRRRASNPLATLLLLAAGTMPAGATQPPRWYDADLVRRGALVYAQSCAGCHGARAEGAPGWQSPGPSGYYPPPPLDATGHAWEHGLQDLVDAITEGGGTTGGVMPPFRATLAEADARAVVAWFQELWPDAVYQAWLQAPGCSTDLAALPEPGRTP
jgi:mono/diheme cytochrome c family protein